jgi:hypothetical protein
MCFLETNYEKTIEGALKTYRTFQLSMNNRTDKRFENYQLGFQPISHFGEKNA